MNNVYIIEAKRTPIGSFLGNLSGFSATQLGAIAIREVIHTTGIDPAEIDSVYLGNVLSANLGQAPARQASIWAGIANKTDCTTINKVCASGLKATIIGAQQIQLGLEDMVITGGMESMSNVPHYQPLRQPIKLGDRLMVDGLLKDGLTDAFDHFHMGHAAEFCASQYQITREQQDEYALSSYTKAAKAMKEQKFKREIIPITIKTKNADVLMDTDEDISKLIPEKVAKLPPAFIENGTITAANASNLNDGAAAILLASEEAVTRLNLKPLARIISYADAAQAPKWFTTTPSIAIEKALQKAKLSIDEIDFFEINEAYAAVVLAHQKILNIPASKINPYGGAVAMGHPLGASGARILCTLISVLKHENQKYGLAAICNGGGGATAMIIENI